ncbi:MAG: asparagine synthase (glutamine-hydrolyzing) [bacterium]
MCGIAGILAEGSNTIKPDIYISKIQKALQHLSHRGPDASGIHIDKDQKIVFGHTRLSILDLSARANQPMQLDDLNITITYNGEIYNFKSLKKELEELGEVFFSTSDTEVLLRGYRNWGFDQLLSRLNGMFCFALYDSTKKLFFLARDRVGIKPVYYAEKNGFLFFSSEVQGLLDIWPGKRNLNLQSLYLYLSFKFTPSPLTLFEGIKRLEPGSYAVSRPHQPLKTIKYWNPLQKSSTHHHVESLEASVDRLFTESVNHRLVSDVPIATFLSGGIDSSLIVAKLNQLNINHPTTYSIGYKDLDQFNELTYSRMIAQRYPINYREIITDAKETEQILCDDKLILDEPISDWIWVPLYVLSRQARQDKFKVILLGEGSDEQFVGYDSMMKLMREQNHVSFLLKSMPWLAKAALSLMSPYIQKSFHGHRTFDLLRRIAQHEPLYTGSSMAFWETQKQQVIGTRLSNHLMHRPPHAHNSWEEEYQIAGYTSHLHDFYSEHADNPEDLINRVCYVEIYTKMIEILLHRVDRITMQNSIEARVPFLDHHLVKKTFAIPGPDKIKGNVQKAFLKKIASPYLPKEILTRKKMGFSFPFKEWLKGSLGKIVEETFINSRLCKENYLNLKFCLAVLTMHRDGKKDYASQVWTLYNLCRWHDRWIS